MFYRVSERLILSINTFPLVFPVVLLALRLLLSACQRATFALTLIKPKT